MSGNTSIHTLQSGLIRDITATGFLHGTLKGLNPFWNPRGFSKRECGILVVFSETSKKETIPASKGRIQCKNGWGSCTGARGFFPLAGFPTRLGGGVQDGMGLIAIRVVNINQLQTTLERLFTYPRINVRHLREQRFRSSHVIIWILCPYFTLWHVSVWHDRSSSSCDCLSDGHVSRPPWIV